MECVPNFGDFVRKFAAGAGGLGDGDARPENGN